MKLRTITTILSVVGVVTLFQTIGGETLEKQIASWISMGFLLTAAIIEVIDHRRRKKVPILNS